MPSQPSFQSIDSNFSGTKPPVTTPNRVSRGSSVRTFVYENRRGDNSVNLNGTSFRLEPSAWQVEQNHCPHGLAPFHLRFPHLKASSLPSSPTRQRWSETATPPWQQYRVPFRYAPHYEIIMHTSYLPTGQRSRLKKAIQMQISSDINPRKWRNNQFFLSCFTRSASSVCLSVLRSLFWFRFSGGVPCSFTHVCYFPSLI